MRGFQEDRAAVTKEVVGRLQGGDEPAVEKTLIDQLNDCREKLIYAGSSLMQIKRTLIGPDEPAVEPMVDKVATLNVAVDCVQSISDGLDVLVDELQRLNGRV